MTTSKTVKLPESRASAGTACSTAIDRGLQMMSVPMRELPPIALDFAKHLCSEVGMCSEVLLTAWTVYAQCVEGLPCDDERYQARPVDREWFTARLF